MIDVNDVAVVLVVIRPVQPPVRLSLGFQFLECQPAGLAFLIAGSIDAAIDDRSSYRAVGPHLLKQG